MWKALIKAIKAHGYTGADDDLAGIQSYVDEHFDGEVELEGKSFDIPSEYSKAYPKKSKLDLTSTAKDTELENIKGELAAAKEALELTGKSKGSRANEITVKVGKDRLADDPNWGYGGRWGDYYADVVEAGGNQTAPGRAVKGSKLESLMNAKASLSTYGNENTGADGGFAVPHTTDNNIQSRVMGESSLLARTDMVTVAGNGYTETRDETTPWGSTGIQAAWEGEAGTIAQSKPVLNQKTWMCHKLAALVPVTNEALTDSVALESHVNAKAPEMIQFKLDEAILRGTGAGMPLGILNSAGTVSVTKETSQPNDTIKATNLQKMLMRMYPDYLRNAVWLVQPDCTVQIHQLFVVGKTDAGTVLGAGGLVFIPTAQDGAPFGTIYQKPILFTQHCETVGDVGDIILADLKQYRSVVKGTGVQSMASPHFWFDQDVTAFRFIFRMGGGPKFETTISPRDGSNTMAAFLTITAR
jgi:HK97 family phage major capsid protein